MPHLQAQLLHSRGWEYSHGWGREVGEGAEGHEMILIVHQNGCTEGTEGEKAGSGGREGPGAAPRGRSLRDRQHTGGHREEGRGAGGGCAAQPARLYSQAAAGGAEPELTYTRDQA